MRKTSKNHRARTYVERDLKWLFKPWPQHECIMRLSKQTCMGNRLRAWSARLCLRETVCTGGGCFWGIVADKNVRCCAPPHRSYCATKKLLDLREICGEVCWKMRPFSRARESKRALAEWRHVTSLTCGKFRGEGTFGFHVRSCGWFYRCSPNASSLCFHFVGMRLGR